MHRRSFGTSAKKQSRKIPALNLHIVFAVDFHIGASEKERNAPERRKADQGVDYAADKRCLPAEDPCDDIESEKTDTAPVKSSDDGQRQRNFIQYHHVYTILCNRLDSNIIGKGG